MASLNALDPASCNDLLTILAEVEDPRLERTRFHKFEDIFAISMCATLSGAFSLVRWWTSSARRTGSAPAPAAPVRLLVALEFVVVVLIWSRNEIL